MPVEETSRTGQLASSHELPDNGEWKVQESWLGSELGMAR